MEENVKEFLNSNNPNDLFNIKIELDDNPIIFISYYAEEDVLESRGDLINRLLPTNCIIPDLSNFILSFVADDTIYVASSKREPTKTIYVGFDKSYFSNINVDNSFFYKTTIKKLYYYIISSRMNKLEAFEKSILCHCKYKGITNSDAAKLLGVNKSDYEMLLSGKIEHIQKMDRKAVLTALGIPQEECSDSYFVNLLMKIEYQEIKNVF